MQFVINGVWWHDKECLPPLSITPIRPRYYYVSDTSINYILCVVVSGWQAAEDYNIVPSQRFLDHDDGDENDVGHDAHPAQAGQDHRGDLVRLHTNTLKCGDTL